jgi:hypothetical protein
MPVGVFGIPPRLGRAGHPLWFCRGSGASLAASSPCRSAQLDRYRGRGQLRVPPDHRSGARWNAIDIPVGRCLIPSIGSARGVVLLKNGIDRPGINRKRLRQEPVSLGIVALSLFMETLFGQSPGVRRYGLGIAGPHIVILHVVVHMDLPCRDNSRPHRLLRDPLHKAARNWSASLEADQGTSCTGGRSVIATRLAQAPVITIPDARSECEDFGSPAIGREYDRTLSWRMSGKHQRDRHITRLRLSRRFASR